jgi:hypothetical protein
MHAEFLKLTRVFTVLTGKKTTKQHKTDCKTPRFIIILLYFLDSIQLFWGEKNDFSR